MTLINRILFVMTFAYLKQKESANSCVFHASNHLYYDMCICAVLSPYVTITYVYDNTCILHATDSTGLEQE